MVILHGYPFSTYTRSALLALEEKGVQHMLVPANLRAPSYTALHPFRKMPVLDHDGFVVFEALAVMRYIDEAFDGPPLQPADAQGRARMTQWCSAYNDFVAPKAVRGVLIPRFVLAPRGVAIDDARVHEAAGHARDALRVFDAALAERPYLAGDSLTLADLLLAPTVAAGGVLTGADRFTDDLPNIAAWMARIAARAAWQKTS